jgi:hypothetical protein
MRAKDIICRLCRVRYNEREGCDVCAPAKRAMILPDKEIPVLESVAAASIFALEQEVDHLRRHLTECRDQGKQPSAEALKVFADLQRTLVGALREARQIERANAATVAKLSYSQKVELILEFIEDLPAEHQEALVQAVTHTYRLPAPAEVLDV